MISNYTLLSHMSMRTYHTNYTFLFPIGVTNHQNYVQHRQENSAPLSTYGAERLATLTNQSLTFSLNCSLGGAPTLCEKK